MTAKPRVLFYTLNDKLPIARAYLERIGRAGDIELACHTHVAGTTPGLEELRGFDAVCGEYMPVDGPSVEEFADAGVRLVASLSIGVNHMDVARLAEKGVLVSNCPGYCADEVAVHAMALMLDLNRKVTATNRTVMAGGWDPKAGHPLRRLRGQTLGLVFFGAIAKAVVPMAQGLGMNVLVWAPTKSAEEVEALGARKVETLRELLEGSDVVSLHCPLVPETERLISAESISWMRPGAHLVNTARGGVIDEDALLAALDSGQVGGAGLDVLASEYHDRNERLIHHPSVVVTPHSAFDSVESEELLVTMSLDSCLELLVDGREPAHTVRA